MFHPVCGAAGPAAGNSHIASHAGKQNGAPGALLPVGIALRAVTLNERRGFCQGIAFARLRMVSAAVPVIRSAHSGVLGIPSFSPYI